LQKTVSSVGKLKQINATGCIGTSPELASRNHRQKTTSYPVFFAQVLNLFLALLLNAFDNGDDEEEGEDENDNDSESEESLFKRVLSKLTQTKTTSVFPVHEYPLADGSCNSSQEIQTTSRKQNMAKEYSNAGKLVWYWTNLIYCYWRSCKTCSC